MADMTTLESGLLATVAAILAAVLSIFSVSKNKVTFDELRRYQQQQIEECDRRHKAEERIVTTHVAAIGNRITSLEETTLASIQRLDAKLDQVLLALAK